MQGPKGVVLGSKKPMGVDIRVFEGSNPEKIRSGLPSFGKKTLNRHQVHFASAKVALTQLRVATHTNNFEKKNSTVTKH